MTNPSKRKRITVTASVKGVELAEKALIRLGFESKENFKNSSQMGKSTIDNFFQRKPIQLNSFKTICEELKLGDWRTIAELKDIFEKLSPENTEKKEDIMPSDVNKQIDPSVTRVITVHPEGELESEITLKGDITSVDGNFKLIIETLINSKLGINITVKDIRPGSIKITIQGSQKDIVKLLDWINSGDFKDLNGFPVQSIQILNPEFLSNINTQIITVEEETISNFNSEEIDNARKKFTSVTVDNTKKFNNNLEKEKKGSNELMKSIISFTATLSQLKKLQKSYARSSKGGDSIIATGLRVKIKQAQAAQLSIRSSLDDTETKISQFSEWNRFLNEILSNPSIVMNFGEVIIVSSLEEFSGLILRGDKPDRPIHQIP